MSSYSFRRGVHVLLFGALLCLQAQAMVVSGVIDSAPGQDRWPISYRVMGALAINESLTLVRSTRQRAQ